MLTYGNIGVLFALGLSLAACTAGERERMVQLDNPTVNAPFDPAAAAYVLEPGSATISGRVYSGQISGEHAQVRLVPVTAYSTETMNLLFGGQKAYYGAKPIKNPDPRYHQHMRHARADSQGNYTFHGVPSGRFYVYGTATNYNKGYGFGHLETLEVVDGQKYQLDLDGI